mgnify:FL=1
MKILGIDPGTIAMGYGMVENVAEELTTSFYGSLSAKRTDPIERRLASLYHEILAIIVTHNPEAIAIEEPFVARNPKTAIAVGQAQAVALIAASSRKIPVYRYSPRQIKKSVTDHGNSSKEQVGDMVKLILNCPDIEGSDDVTDALAVAICHHNNSLAGNFAGD